MRIFFAAALIIVSCSPRNTTIEPALGYTFMPSYFDFDSIHVVLPKEPEEVIDTTLPDFKTFNIRSGLLTISYLDSTLKKVFTDTIKLRYPGFIISEKTGQKYIFYKAGYTRQLKELEMSKYLSKEFYDKSRHVEALYQKEIERLRKGNQRTWLDKNMVYLGVASGIALTVLTEFAVIKTAR